MTPVPRSGDQAKRPSWLLGGGGRGRPLLVLISGAAIAIALVAARPGRVAADKDSLPRLRSVAVLPLADRRRPASRAQDFADGMTEALIAHLSTASDLRDRRVCR